MTSELVVSTADADAIITQDPNIPGRYKITKTQTVTTTTVTAVTVDIDVQAIETQTEMLLGMTGLPGTEWDNILAYYGADKIGALRLFGKDNLFQTNGAYDVDTLTEWQKWNTEKWAGADKRALPVLSVKDDADEFLDAWAATFPPPLDLAMTGFKGAAASYWHEPEDDVRRGAFGWAAFRQQGMDIVSWRNRHPRGKELIRYVGPILTKWDLVNLNNDPRNAGFDGMNIFMFDTYQSSPNDGRYATPEELIDEPIARIDAAYKGIDIGIPEFGLARQANDSTGVPWADAHELLVNHMRATKRVKFAIAYNSVGSMPEVPFYCSGPVAQRYRDKLLRPFS